MNEILKIWDLIVQSNTFNFAILVLMIAIVISKLRLGDKIEQLKQAIINTIETAKKEKEQALTKLNSAKADVANLEDEINTLIATAERNAQAVSKEIMNTAGDKVARYEENSLKSIVAEEKKISTKLSQQTASAAVELAKYHIKKVLGNNYELHKKFINNSIEELDKVNIS